MQRHRGRRRLTAHDIAQLDIHAEIADQLGGKQIGIEALERDAGVRLTPDHQEARQQLANRAGIDVALGVAHRAR